MFLILLLSTSMPNPGLSGPIDDWQLSFATILS